MKFYYAPLEGMTGYVYRNIHRDCYKDIDKYFAPFIVTHKTETFKNKEIRDVSPENNMNYTLIPQLLTNNGDEFLYTTQKLIKMGYDEVNINFGCPSKTVISKFRGSGFLTKLDEMDRFFEQIFNELPSLEKKIKVSVKTRIGKDSAEEFKNIMEVYNRYPLEELIIHPRVQKDFYSNIPNYEVFASAFETSKNPICYNGDINRVEDYKNILELVPTLERMMLGRGLIANPALVRELITGQKISKEELKIFHDKLYQAQKNYMSGDVNVLYKMKEIWLYMIRLFEDSDKYGKKIRKSQKLYEYEEVIKELFELMNIT